MSGEDGGPEQRMELVASQDRVGLGEVLDNLRHAERKLEEIEHQTGDLSFNCQAAMAALKLARHWLDPDTSLPGKLAQVQADLGALAQAQTSFAWLFDENGEPRMDMITAEVFEKLVELRVFADRLQRMLDE